MHNIIYILIYVDKFICDLCEQVRVGAENGEVLSQHWWHTSVTRSTSNWRLVFAKELYLNNVSINCVIIFIRFYCIDPSYSIKFKCLLI